MFRSTLPVSAGIVLSIVSGTAAAQAQGWPSKPLRILSPYTAGSTVDIMARIIAPKLSGALGQQVIVENRGGAGGAIGMEATARAPKDGYTVMLAASGFAVIPGLNKNLSWDPVRDFAPISLVANAPLVIVVTPDLPVKTLPELVSMARSQPGKLRFGHAGIGSSQHMAGELLCYAAGIDLTHVPYKGGKESLADMLGGRLEMSFQGVAAVLPQLRSGQVRPVVVTGTRRSAAIPDVPTIGEAGQPGAAANVWYGLLTPSGVPAPVIARLNSEVVVLMKSPEVVEGFEKSGAEAASSTSEEFGRIIRNDVATWARVIAQRGIKGE